MQTFGDNLDVACLVALLKFCPGAITQHFNQLNGLILSMRLVKNQVFCRLQCAGQGRRHNDAPPHLHRLGRHRSIDANDIWPSRFCAAANGRASAQHYWRIAQRLDLRPHLCLHGLGQPPGIARLTQDGLIDDVGRGDFGCDLGEK